MNLYVNTLWYLQAVLDNSIMEIYAQKLYLGILLRSLKPQVALVSSSINSYIYKWL